MRIRGLRTLKALLQISWRYLPLYLVHQFSNLLPNDEIFKSVRCFLLKLFGLNIKTSCVFGKNIFVLNYRNLIVGENSVINHEIYFDNYKEVIIGKGCDIGFRSCFITGNHRLESDFVSCRPIDEENCKPIVVEDFVWIGANVTVLPGVTIGRGAVVGAGSVVTKDVEENSLVVGVPARKIKSLV